MHQLYLYAIILMKNKDKFSDNYSKLLNGDIIKFKLLRDCGKTAMQNEIRNRENKLILYNII
jgi:hypothetical protein